MEFHELSNIFPMMSDAEFAALVEDIREHGLREAIWTHDGKIIDGRNRFKACEQLGIKPAFRKWDGKGSLISFVVSLNLHRRHLNESQRAMVAAKIANMGVGGDSANRSIDLFAQSTAAEMLNVSVPSVKRAKKVQESGDEKLIADVESGKVAVSAAAQHVAAVTRYPELRNISREKDLFTIVKNLDAMAEDARTEARSALLRHDQSVLAVLAEKPPMPKLAPKKKMTPADKWRESLAQMSRFFSSVDRIGGAAALTERWTERERRAFFNELCGFRAAADRHINQLTEAQNELGQKAAT
jgi:hypothetical protein